MVENILEWLNGKVSQHEHGWKAHFWFVFSIVVQAIILPPHWIFGRNERRSRKENGESLLDTFRGVLILWEMVWSVLLSPFTLLYGKYVWPHTRKGKAVAQEIFATFQEQLNNCLREDNPEMAFACWLDYIRDFDSFPRELQRGWDLLKEKFPEVAKNYQTAYPLALEYMKIKA